MQSVWHTSLVRLRRFVLETTWAWAGVLAINLAGFVYGIWWYRDQLPRFSPLAWPLVADCPVAALLVFIALALTLAGRGRGWLWNIAAGSAIKYGFWTCFVLAHFWLKGGPVAMVDVGLFVSHVGLAAQGFLFAPLGSRRLAALVAVGGWLWANDIADYVFLTHPDLPDPAAFGLVSLVTIVSTFVVLWVVYKLARERSGCSSCLRP